MSKKEPNGNVGAVGDDSIAARFIQDGLQERSKNKQEIQAKGQVAVPGNPGQANINRTYGSRQVPIRQPGEVTPGALAHADAVRTLLDTAIPEIESLPAAKTILTDHFSQAVTGVYTRQVVINIYHMLIEHAERGETVVYEKIAKVNGLPTSGSQLGQVIAPLLSRIYDYCVSRGLPHLTSIVVRKSGNEKGLPGNGFWKLLSNEGIEQIGNIVVTDSSGNPVDLTNDSKRQITHQLQEEVYEHYSLKGI